MNGNSFIDAFVKEQIQLINKPKPTVKQNKDLIQPDKIVQIAEPTLDDLYNDILEKKPAKKRVQDFLQRMVDCIIEEDA